MKPKILTNKEPSLGKGTIPKPIKAKEEGRTKIMMNDLSIMEDNDPSEDYKNN